ncbi:HIT family protein [Streptomyces cinereospinus]|uniref:HIT family protein n=1 Tax=Streptomyces cinereospinus TaxID=285561 RepID=A0ABV5N9Q7_9ACTN
MEQNCLICGLDESEESDVVFRDDLWAAEIVPSYDVPGWFFLRARRHAERITGLDEAELETFGRRARDLVAAVTQATGAEATYILMFGESFPHFHALIAARTADVPADRRAGDILKLRTERADLDGARALVPAVRDAYARLASQALVPSQSLPVAGG